MAQDMQQAPSGDGVTLADVEYVAATAAIEKKTVNGAGQIVGQLSGACGTNVNDTCDSINNATVDGAFAAYFAEIANILEGWELSELELDSARRVHLLAEAMKRAYSDRNAYLGDPAFVNMPVERMISEEYGAQRRTESTPGAIQRRRRDSNPR